MGDYVAAVQRGAAALLGVGLTALIVAAALLRSATASRGMVAALAGIGLVQVVVAASVLARARWRWARLQRLLPADPERCRRAEQDRMRRAHAWFRLTRALELMVLTAGLTLVLIFPRRHPMYAAGLACFLQGSLTLVLDRLAERRAHDYASALRQDG
jgi:hypothetical protein